VAPDTSLRRVRFLDMNAALNLRWVERRHAAYLDMLGKLSALLQTQQSMVVFQTVAKTTVPKAEIVIQWHIIRTITQIIQGIHTTQTINKRNTEDVMD
jgi:hypothetical protein